MSNPRRQWSGAEFHAVFTFVLMVLCFSVSVCAFERRVLSATAAETVIGYTVPLPTLDVKQAPTGELFSVVKMTASGHAAPVGFPDLPMLVDDVRIPARGDVTVSMEVQGVRRLRVPHWVYPRQPAVPKVPGALLGRGFVVDRDWYRRKTSVRGVFDPVLSSQTYRRRGERYVRIVAAGCDYDPVSGELRVPTQLTLRVQTAEPSLSRAAGPRLGGISILGVEVPSAAALHALVDMGLDIKTVRRGEAIVYADDSEVKSVRAAGFTAAVIGRQPEPDEPRLSRGKELTGYHSFSEISAMLHQYVVDYPALCRLESLGTSVLGRDIPALKITDFPDIEEDEPEVKFVGGIHGDEVPSVELCIRFIDMLLTLYDSDAAVRDLVDSTEIWIVPVMNPDGYEFGWRTNADGYDLNRTFPEGTLESIGTVFSGPSMDLTGRPPETVAIMEWSAAQSFVLSGTFHSGALVANYPYDNDGAGSTFSPTPDQDVFLRLAETYSSHNPPMWNSTEFANGVTNGAAWYAISGGLQDWLYRYTGCFDITLEISEDDLPSPAAMDALWSDNRAAMLAYLRSVHRGIRGLVTDADDQSPVYASIAVSGRTSRVYTDPDVGDFQRMLEPGVYDITVSAPGYRSVSLKSVIVTDGAASRLDVSLRKGGTASGSTIIVVHHEDHDPAFAAYRDQKQSEGFAVAEVRVSGQPSAESIRDDIRSAYVDTGAEFVVLMGDVEAIPTFFNDDYSRAQTGYAAHSDLPYALLDPGETFDDYLGKDVRIGRLSLDSDADLQDYVSKLGAFVTAPRHRHLTWVSGGATSSENDIAEGTHNFVIEHYIDADEYTVERFFRHDGNAAALTAAINAGTDAVIYSGHGLEYGWLRYDYDVSKLAFLTNVLDAPIVLGHCCLTGSFQLGDCFAEAWLLTTARAVAYIGASESTLWDEDDVLEKKEFEWMSTYPGTPISAALDYGLEQVAATYPNSGEFYYTIYHLFGDPTVALLGAPLMVQHTPVADTSSSAGPYLVQAAISAREPLDTAAVHWRADPDEPFTTTPMIASRDALYTASIPGQPYGTTVQYYIRVTDTVGREVIVPETAPAALYAFDVGMLIGHSALGNTADTAGPYAVTAHIAADDAVSATLHWAVNDADFSSVSMVDEGGGVFVADIPGQASGATLSYYLQASAGAYALTDPAQAPDDTYGFLVDTQPPVFAGLADVIPGAGRAILSWEPATDDSSPITYLVYRATGPGTQAFGVPLGTTSELTYTDETVVNGTTYYYVVRAQDALGNRETNTVERPLTAQGLERILSWPLDSDPGWEREGAWGFGEPAGLGGLAYGNPDPDSAFTGTNVFGYNLLGDYANSMPARYLTTELLDCSELTDVELRFRRWLNVEVYDYDQASVEVSCNGGEWHTVWHNVNEITDDAWELQVIDLSEHADGCQSVRVRWGMGPTDSSWTYSGWNLDDIELWGVPAPERYQLGVTVTPPGAGSVILTPLPGSGGTYSEGSYVTLIAEAGAGYIFEAWSGDLTDTGTTVQVMMDSDLEVTATFAPVPLDVIEVLAVGVPDGGAFPLIAAEVRVDTNAGNGCGLGLEHFSVTENDVPQTVVSVLCDDSVYTLTYETSLDHPDGMPRTVIVTVDDPEVGVDHGAGTYAAPLDANDLTASRVLIDCAEPGESIALYIVLDYEGPGMLTSLVLTDTLPAEWTFQGVISELPPTIQPATGASGTLEFAWDEMPPLPHTFGYQVEIPADETAETACFAGEVVFHTGAAQVTRAVEGSPCLQVGGCCRPHDADQDGSWTIELSPELTRLIQFYNAGGFHCQEGTEDGYAPGEGPTDCPGHDADQNGNWMIELSPELTRLIQFYNSDGYHCQSGTEDGYAPGLTGTRAALRRKGTATAIRSVEPGVFEPGELLEITLTIEHSEPAMLTALAVFEELPDGWVFEQVVAGVEPPFRPSAGATGELAFGWLTMPTSWPVVLTLRVRTSAEQAGSVSLHGRVAYREGGGEVVETIAGENLVRDRGTPAFDPVSENPVVRGVSWTGDAHTSTCRVVRRLMPERAYWLDRATAVEREPIELPW